MLVDTHAHLFWNSYKDDLDQVADRALKAGVETIVNVGVDVPLSEAATKQDIPGINLYSAIALHPEEAINYFDLDENKTDLKIKEDIEKLEQIYLENPKKVVAIGECGLDYAYFQRDGYLPKEVSLDQAKNLQRKLFQAQIDLAKKLNLPLLLHIRDDRSKNPNLIECWNEAFEMAGDHFGILHCYSGLEETTKKAIGSNYLVSFAGNLTYLNNKYLQEAVKILPLEKICLETDCPFLPPQSIRGQRNEPASVKEIAQFIAELKNTPFEKVAEQTTLNVKALLKI